MEISVDVRENLLRARDIFASPKKFLKATNKEKDWKKALSFVIVISLIGHIFTTIYNILFYPLIASSVGQNLGLQPASYNLAQVVTAAIVSYIITIAMSFVLGGALKLCLSLFKVESTFAEAYKVMVYSGTPNYILGWFPFVNAVAALYSIYLMLLALEYQYSLSRKKALFIIVSSLVLLFVISIVGFSLLLQGSQI